MVKKQPSKLGLEIADAIAKRSDVVPYSADFEKGYALLFKTTKDLPFAVERVTTNKIRIWFGENKVAEHRIRSVGIESGKNVYSGNPKTPGWNIHIAGIAEFKTPSYMCWAYAGTSGEANKIIDILVNS